MIIIKKAAQILIGQLCTTVEQRRVLWFAGRLAASRVVFSQPVVVIETRREKLGEGPIRSHDDAEIRQPVLVLSERLVTIVPAQVLLARYRRQTAGAAQRHAARLLLLSECLETLSLFDNYRWTSIVVDLVMSVSVMPVFVMPVSVMLVSAVMPVYVMSVTAVPVVFMASRRTVTATFILFIFLITLFAAAIVALRFRRTTRQNATRMTLGLTGVDVV